MRNSRGIFASRNTQHIHSKNCALSLTVPHRPRSGNVCWASSCQETIVVGILVDRLGMEFVRWTTADADGSPFDRPAESDRRFSGIESLPPNRDRTARWERHC
ncbi:hypothetical protein C8A03DRAFT_17895 [Achaetomium macrosporum]|uniref:Uncharacterized protein n=1 Tax=Achaetomium macrosporum TaxID=79813 RepID=A0AAN7C4Q0_9PEZI|nr:hypothetical protein C8A03DRAFT_17895 [Achaetomium macrosporum]